MDFTLLSSLAVIHTVALMSPGPDFAIIVKMASQQSRTNAFYCAFGIALAILIHTLLSLMGISLMIQQSPVAYSLVQLIGISYLGWMGLSALKGGIKQFRQSNRGSSSSVTATNANTAQNDEHMSAFHSFRIGLFTNLLNPKALIFFITLFTVLVTPQVGLDTKVAATVLLFGLSLIWFVLLALVFSEPRIQQKLLNNSCYIDMLVGVIFCSVAITILATQLTSLFH